MKKEILLKLYKGWLFIKKIFLAFINFCKEYSTLAYLIISCLIMQCSIICYNNYMARQAQEELKLSQLQVYQIALDKTQRTIPVGKSVVTKAQYEKIQEQINIIFREQDNITYMHSYTEGDTIRYELTIKGTNDRYLHQTASDFEQEINILCSRLKYAWAKEGIDKHIIIAVLDERTTERVLLMSEDSQITFSIHHTPEKEGTKADWIYLFIYENGYEPTEEEYEAFRKQKELEIEKYRATEAEAIKIELDALDLDLIDKTEEELNEIYMQLKTPPAVELPENIELEENIEVIEEIND